MCWLAFSPLSTSQHTNFKIIVKLKTTCKSISTLDYREKSLYDVVLIGQNKFGKNITQIELKLKGLDKPFEIDKIYLIEINGEE